MKQFIFACILLICMNACSYGQDRSYFSGQRIYGNMNDPAIQKMSFVMAVIERFYVDSIDNSKLAEDAIISLLEKLDPHSYYMTAAELKKANEQLDGNFDGIGIQFNMLTDTLYVVQVIPDGPSEKVGLLAGDKIIFVDDTLIAGVKMRDTDIMSKLKGPKGTKVNIKILRSGYQKLLDFKIVRDKIPVYSINASYMIDDKTGYIRLIRFARTTTQEFREALGKLKEQGMENLILDLQNNGGGILETAVELSNEFLKPRSLIVYTEGTKQSREDYKSNNNGSFRDGKLVILVNGASASASEIVSGAVQDWDRGVIIGQRTFGKGLVQRPFPMPDGSMIRLTTAHYYTPTGRSIQKPYTKGDSETYNKELIDRYNRREMFSTDSIHFPDSLKYNTMVKNRIVYGGGGIMPDYFVPFDTTSAFYTARTTPLFEEMDEYHMGIFYKYTRTVIEENRKKYQEQYPVFDSFNKNFTVTNSMLNDMLEIYKKEKAEELEEKTYQLTEEQQKDFEKSKSLMSQIVKAYIAREIFSDSEFYHLLNPLYDSYNKAIEIISDEEQYYKLLNQGRG